MMTRYDDYPEQDDNKCFHLLKADNELFNEEDNKPNVLITVRRAKNDWQILEDKKVILTLKGNRFSKSEKDFLGTVPGLQFLLSAYKSGAKSVVKIKERMKDHA